MSLGELKLSVVLCHLYMVARVELVGRPFSELQNFLSNLLPSILPITEKNNRILFPVHLL